MEFIKMKPKKNKMKLIPLLPLQAITKKIRKQVTMRNSKYLLNLPKLLQITRLTIQMLCLKKKLPHLI